MFRATRSIWQKAPIRPKLQNVQPPKQNGSANSSNLKVTPFGVVFILGGLVLASYVFKPSTRTPTAALDNFKPQVAVIFATGDSQDTFKKLASTLGFSYLDVQHDLDTMGELVQQGRTHFFIEGFKDAQNLQEVCQTVVQPDLILDFGNGPTRFPVAAPRVVKVNAQESAQIETVLKQKNLV